MRSRDIAWLGFVGLLALKLSSGIAVAGGSGEAMPAAWPAAESSRALEAAGTASEDMVGRYRASAAIGPAAPVTSTHF
jgi:hypothetical protein